MCIYGFMTEEGYTIEVWQELNEPIYISSKFTIYDNGILLSALKVSSILFKKDLEARTHFVT